ncbi:MAG TPA: NAD-dependent epimerase/dehydratase family protein [Polyangiaceae bacterium]|nr:NAD-dependent epimerase/dehydratase family protein [Polyangiaceae bacterium]
MGKFWVGGATGFLGSHVVQCLLADGHDVVAVARGGGSVHGIPVKSVDVLDENAVLASARGVDGAFLATGKVSRDAADAEELHRVNVHGVRHALRGLRGAAVKRVVYASTSGTVAISKDPDVATEDSEEPLELIQKWPYYRTKRYGEMEALEANAPPDFEVVIVNPSLLLGPGDLRESSTGDVRKFLEGEILALPRGGLAMVDVRDAARAMVSALSRGVPGERYLLSAANLSMHAFFDRLERLSGVPAPKFPLPKSSSFAAGLTRLFGEVVEKVGGELPMDEVSVEMAQHYWYCDSQKAIDELGFSPRDPNATLRDTVLDLVERGVAHPRVGHHAPGGGASELSGSP